MPGQTQEDSSATVNRVDSVDGALPLSQCLDEFVKLETLSPEDLWYCPRCKVRSSVES